MANSEWGAQGPPTQFATRHSLFAGPRYSRVWLREELRALRIQFVDLQGDLAALREQRAGGDGAPIGLRVK
jgi:hypothetical protein